jgi:hypothetical protein
MAQNICDTSTKRNEIPVGCGSTIGFLKSEDGHLISLLSIDISCILTYNLEFSIVYYHITKNLTSQNTISHILVIK